MIIVTTNEIPGYRIDAVLGEVMGMTVRSANIGANVVAGFRAIGGGEVSEYTRLVYESRNEVMNRMWSEAERRGGNAIVGMRFDNGSIGQQFTEFCAYGTAVVVRPIAEDEDGATPQSIQQAGARHSGADPTGRQGQQQFQQPSRPGPQPVPGRYGYAPQVPPPAGPPGQGRQRSGWSSPTQRS